MARDLHTGPHAGGYAIEGRQFRTEGDYARAKRDKELIDRLRARIASGDKGALEKLRTDLKDGKYRFLTILGQDFLEEVEEKLRRADTQARGKTAGSRGPAGGRNVRSGSAVGGRASGGGGVKGSKNSPGVGRSSSDAVLKKGDSRAIDSYVQEELKNREKRRRIIMVVCSLAAACSLGYFGIYSYYEYRTESTNRQLSELKSRPPISASTAAPKRPAATEGPLYTLTEEQPAEREVLEEFKNLLIKNKKLIGWLKIDDTNIDYPVMQTSDNKYYLEHNLDQEYDKNGSIFLDKDCDIVTPSTNYIIYGHHMQSGRMFGKLDLYQKKDYCEKHPYIQFDTIYEKGTYQVMYVFRSRVYSEEDVVFKYYQFIDVNSKQEFDSYMDEMAKMALYDTGVTAQYGDHLLTLSTCDYQEKNGRFVVVAKKIAKE